MRALWLLLALAACEPEPQLVVAAASLHDDAPVYQHNADAKPLEPTDAERRMARLRVEITAENALERAKALEATLDEEIENLETRLKPVEIDMGGE